MGDGSSNILNLDSLKDFDGKYGFGKTDSPFPADAFILNPPYSALGNGMNFVEKVLGMMNKGDAAIIIQNLTNRLRNSDINWQLSEEEILEKRLSWAKNSIKDIKRIEARYYEENPK